MGRYTTISPAIFREGDIVDVEATFILVPIKQGMHKMMGILRSLTLLDSKYSEVS
jgi:hypothetical protein